MNFLGDLGDDLPLPKEKKGERDACGSIESMSPGDFLPPRIKKENVIVDIEKRCKMNKTGNKMSNRIAVMQTVRVCVWEGGEGGSGIRTNILQIFFDFISSNLLM